MTDAINEKDLFRNSIQVQKIRVPTLDIHYSTVLPRDKYENPNQTMHCPIQDDVNEEIESEKSETNSKRTWCSLDAYRLQTIRKIMAEREFKDEAINPKTLFPASNCKYDHNYDNFFKRNFDLNSDTISDTTAPYNTIDEESKLCSSFCHIFGELWRPIIFLTLCIILSAFIYNSLQATILDTELATSLLVEKDGLNTIRNDENPNSKEWKATTELIKEHSSIGLPEEVKKVRKVFDLDNFTLIEPDKPTTMNFVTTTEKIITEEHSQLVNDFPRSETINKNKTLKRNQVYRKNVKNKTIQLTGIRTTEDNRLGSIKFFKKSDKVKKVKGNSKKLKMNDTMHNKFSNDVNKSSNVFIQEDIDDGEVDAELTGPGQFLNDPNNMWSQLPRRIKNSVEEDEEGYNCHSGNITMCGDLTGSRYTSGPLMPALINDDVLSQVYKLSNCGLRARDFLCSILEPDCIKPKLPCERNCRALHAFCNVPKSLNNLLNCENFPRNKCTRSVPYDNGECLINEEKCSDGTCIPLAWKCDGRDDCGDASDEEGCTNTDFTCDANHFRCLERGCIPFSWVCDGYSDCVEGEDEVDCETVTAKVDTSKLVVSEDDIKEIKKPPSTFIKPQLHTKKPNKNEFVPEESVAELDMEFIPQRIKCLHNELQCSDGNCIHFHEVCNGKNDCLHGEDEANCYWN